MWLDSDRYVVYIDEIDGDYLFKRRFANGQFPGFVKVPCLRRSNLEARQYFWKTYNPRILAIPLTEELEREGYSHPLPVVVIELYILEALHGPVNSK